MTRIISFCILLVSFDAPVHAFEPDFSCSDIDDLIETMEAGVDQVVSEFLEDPEYFVDYTIDGWKCATEPLPPLRNGRHFLEAVQCFVSDDNLDVTESMLAESGTIFQKKLDSVYSCLEEDIVSERAKSYTHTSRGEGMQFVLDRYIEEHFIILEFGYFQDSAVSTPITWEISALIGSRRRD